MLNQASPIKRTHARKAELESRKNWLFESVHEIHACTVRQCCYQAEVRGVVEKTETDYDKVKRALAEMRRAGALLKRDRGEGTTGMFTEQYPYSGNFKTSPRHLAHPSQAHKAQSSKKRIIL
jgi:hypothetical protein